MIVYDDHQMCIVHDKTKQIWATCENLNQAVIIANAFERVVGEPFRTMKLDIYERDYCESIHK